MGTCPYKDQAHLINPGANRLYSTECTRDQCEWWDSVANLKYNVEADKWEHKGQCGRLNKADLTNKI